MLATSIAHDLFDIGVPIAEKAIRTAAVYGGILVLLRVAGKRDLAELNSFDLVVLLLLSNVVQNAIIGNDNSLLGGLLGAAVLFGLNALLVHLAQRREGVARLLEGTPTELVHDGQLRQDALRRLGLRPADVEVALRRQGASSLAQVASAVLEPGGSIVVTFRKGDEPATKDDVRRLEQKIDALSRGGGPAPAGR